MPGMNLGSRANWLRELRFIWDEKGYQLSRSTINSQLLGRSSVFLVQIQRTRFPGRKLRLQSLALKSSTDVRDSGEALSEFARANLAHFKAPYSVTFVKELPKTAIGK